MQVTTGTEGYCRVADYVVRLWLVVFGHVHRGFHCIYPFLQPRGNISASLDGVVGLVGTRSFVYVFCLLGDGSFFLVSFSATSRLLYYYFISF